jgi:protein transport protein SEC20
MSFQSLSERLAVLQDSNAQLKSLIERLANIKFQPGSVPLGDGDDNVKTELASEISQTIKDQEEDLDLLQEEVIDLTGGRLGSELYIQKQGLALAVKRTIGELSQ